MNSASVLEELTRQFTENLPAGLRLLAGDIKQHIHHIFQKTLSQLQLVPMEEFEIQSEVLRQTLAKLKVLEQQVAALEQAARSPSLV